jgi:hypothetical protein
MPAPRRGKGPSAVLVAVALALPLTWAALAPDSAGAWQSAWRIRGRLRPAPHVDWGSARRLPPTMGSAEDAACARARGMLRDGNPHSSRLAVRMLRRRGDGSIRPVPDPWAGCASRFGKRSAFRLQARVIYRKASRGRVLSRKMSLGSAFNFMSDRMTDQQRRVLRGARPVFSLRLVTREKEVRPMIKSLARRYRVGVRTAVRVARCESRFRPRAYNPAGPYGGVYQQDMDYWPARARKYGHRGESVFDAHANVDVSLRMARDAGWGHWGCY